MSSNNFNCPLYDDAQITIPIHYPQYQLESPMDPKYLLLYFNPTTTALLQVQIISVCISGIENSLQQ